MEPNFRNSEYHSLNAYISDHWDRNVVMRAMDIENGTDSTYNNVIIPWVLNQIKNFTSHESNIIDIGCGCGFLTNAIHNEGIHHIIGVDLSKDTILYAKSKYPQIIFLHGDICTMSFSQTFDIGIAIMTLNNMPDLDLFLEAAYRIISDKGHLIIIIPHPCFWPIKHLQNRFVSYLSEQKYVIDFSTKGQKNYPAQVLYFHRPIETYCDSIEKKSFYIKFLEELHEDGLSQPSDMLGIVVEKYVK